MSPTPTWNDWQISICLSERASVLWIRFWSTRKWMSSTLREMGGQDGHVRWGNGCNRATRVHRPRETRGSGQGHVSPQTTRDEGERTGPCESMGHRPPLILLVDSTSKNLSNLLTMIQMFQLVINPNKRNEWWFLPLTDWSIFEGKKFYSNG